MKWVGGGVMVSSVDRYSGDKQNGMRPQPRDHPVSCIYGEKKERYEASPNSHPAKKWVRGGVMVLSVDRYSGDRQNGISPQPRDHPV